MNKILAFALLVSLVACKNNDPKVDPPNPDAPQLMSYSIITTFPHDTSAYTEGLLVYKGELYESAGNYGSSKLKKLDIKTGKSVQEVSLDKKYFGEGISIINDTVYQLTYKEKTVFVYSLKDLKKIKEFTVDIEGWGMTTDGKQLIVSVGGTSELNFYDPATFKLLKTQTVTESGSPIADINELEWVNGSIYANQYGLPYVLKIDPNSGKVLAKADLTKEWDKVKRMRPGVNSMDIVPNGIAYDSATKKFYITGKWWPELYEVQFSQ